MISRMIGLVVVLIALSMMSGCGSDQDEPAKTVPTEMPVPTAAQPLVLFGPYGTSEIFTTFRPIVPLSGLPYDLRVVEGLAVDAGIRGTLDGVFDIMILTRRPYAEEPLAFLEVARTPVVIFVNPELGITDLSRRQVEMIFAGAITNWSEVGGPDLAIVVLILPESDLLTQAVREQILGDTLFPAEALMLPISADVLAVVRGLPGTIGYELWAGKKYLDFKSSTDYAGIVSLAGVMPDDPDYPYFASVGWAYLPERQPFLQPLLDWNTEIACSEAGQLIARQFGVSTICQN